MTLRTNTLTVNKKCIVMYFELFIKRSFGDHFVMKSKMLSV